ncbi:MAG: STAS domain-containing protein [Chloroflexaceae bacterium]|jgi:anti-anti-sigma factor|nr:STAS domain-containing protein [Chloroflexaceae bacterium]
MVAHIRQWLSRTALTDPIERQQAPLFQAFLLIVICLQMLILFVSTGIAGGPQQGRTVAFLSAIVGLLAPIVAMFLLRRGVFKLAVLVAALGFIAAQGIAIVAYGAELIPATPWLLIPVVMVGLLAGRRELLAVSGLALIATVGHAAGSRGIDITSPLGAILLRIPFTTLIITIIISSFFWAFGSTLRRALATALSRERDLAQLRDSLEQQVQERTAALNATLAEVEARAAEQQRLLHELETQRDVIREMSVPVLPVHEHTLVMPLVGALDTERLRQVQEQALRSIEQSRARTLLLDITGVPVVDSQVAQGLVSVVQAARLLGAEVALVGIRPEVAQAIVGLGLDLSNITTRSSLQSGITAAALGRNGQALAVGNIRNTA